MIVIIYKLEVETREEAARTVKELLDVANLEPFDVHDNVTKESIITEDLLYQYQ